MNAKAYLDGKEVSASEIDPNRHRYVGMWRPPEFMPNPRPGSPGEIFVLYCRCGGTLINKQQALDHWLQGHFDVPEYATVIPVTTRPGQMEYVIRHDAGLLGGSS